jgi:hypothetical protein
VAAGLGGWSGSSGGRRGDRRMMVAGAFRCGGGRARETAIATVEAVPATVIMASSQASGHHLRAGGRR